MQREEFFKVIRQKGINREVTNKKEDTRNMGIIEKLFCYVRHVSYMRQNEKIDEREGNTIRNTNKIQERKIMNNIYISQYSKDKIKKSKIHGLFMDLTKERGNIRKSLINKIK